MVRRWLWFGLRVGILLAIAVVVAKVVRSRRPAVSEPWDPITPRPAYPSAAATAGGGAGTAQRVEPPVAEPSVEEQIAAEPPAEVEADIEAEEGLDDEAVVEAGAAAETGAAANVAWVEPEGDACPASHPVKAKMGSRLFHLPGMVAYNRTRPDRCYTDAAAAEADGFTRAKR